MMYSDSTTVILQLHGQDVTTQIIDPTPTSHTPVESPTPRGQPAEGSFFLPFYPQHTTVKCTLVDSFNREAPEAKY